MQLLLCSLYEIYRALEDELDKNSGHPAVEPIYFPQELARLESLEQDLEFFFGPQWRKRVTVPAATVRYTERLREVQLITQYSSSNANYRKIGIGTIFSMNLICYDERNTHE